MAFSMESRFKISAPDRNPVGPGTDRAIGATVTAVRFDGTLVPCLA